MELSNRLLEVTKFVPLDSNVLDVGTDHGYVPVYLVKNNISKKVIASDISYGSLEKTINYVNFLDLNDRIFPRLGDGLDIIKPYEIDTVIIAGMGGILISDILDNNKEVCNTIENFIFQPMGASKELRKYLLENDYTIIDESLAKEGKRFYEIILAKKGKGHISKEIYLEISHKLIEKNHPLLKEFIINKKNEVEEIIKKLGDLNNDKVRLRYEDLKNILQAYEEVEKEIESQ